MPENLKLDEKCTGCKQPKRWRSRSFSLWFAPSVRGCPHRMVTAGGVDLVNAELAYQTQGTLPHPGGLGDQPQWLVEGFELVRSAVRDTLRLWEERQVAEVKRVAAALAKGA